MRMQLFVGLLLFADVSSNQDLNTPNCEQQGQQLFQLTHGTNTPVIGDDADFLEDANNPLDKMYAWEDAQPKTAQITEDSVAERLKASAEALYMAKGRSLMNDKDEDRDDKREAKAADDKDLGNEAEEASFDCNEELDHWQRGWSDKKKKFCCRTRHLGCNATNNATNASNASNATNATNATNASACVTRKEPRAKSAFYKTSPAGTPCLFGVDPRDEGSHCILEDDSYGSYGWCWTSGSHWGSCSESCPLFGPSKVLGAKIEKIDTELGAKVRAEVKKVLGEQKGHATAEPAADGITLASGKTDRTGPSKDK